MKRACTMEFPTINRDLYRNIPEEMQEKNQWILFKLVYNEEKSRKLGYDKCDKYPYQANAEYFAKSNDPSTWASFDECVEKLMDMSGEWVLGFAFNDDFVGIDIDNSDYKNIIKSFRTYTERSISKVGVHNICRGTLPFSGKKRGDHEIYTQGRFFVMTGDIIDENTSPYIEERQEAIDAFIDEYIKSEPKFNNDSLIVQKSALSPEEIIKNLSKDAKAKALFDGDMLAYPSHSEADGALCMKLAFYCQKDPVLMDKIYRMSGLMRDKWDSPRDNSTYGKKLIQDCITIQKDSYALSVPFVNEDYETIKEDILKIDSRVDIRRKPEIINPILDRMMNLDPVNKAALFAEIRKHFNLKVKDTDVYEKALKEKQRKPLRTNSDLFIIKEGGYFCTSQNINDYVTNFTVVFKKIKKPISGDGKTLVEGNVVFADKVTIPFCWDSEVLADSNKFRSEIVKKRPNGHWFNSHALNMLLPWISRTNNECAEMGYIESTGYYKSCFVTPSVLVDDGRIVENDKYEVVGEETSLHDFTRGPHEKIEEALGFLISEIIPTQPSITCPLLGQMFYAPIRREIDAPRYILAIEGTTGSGKSLICKIFMALYRPGGVERNLYSSNCTANFIERIGYDLKDIPLVWDDFKAGISNSKQLIGVIQRYYDQGGRGRLNRNSEAKKTYYIRAELIMTGEQSLVDCEKSSLERMLIIRAKKADLKLDNIQDILKKSRNLNCIMPRYIAYMQKKEIKLWNGDIDTSHNRIALYARQNLTGLHYFINFIESEFPELYKKYNFNNIFQEAVKVINNAVQITTGDAKVAEDVEVFLESIREGISSGDMKVRGFREDSDGDQDENNFKRDVIGGCIDREMIYLIPSKCLEEMKKCYGRKFTANAIGRSLKEKQYLCELGKDNTPSVSKWIGGTAVRVWVLKRRIIEGEGEECVVPF